MKRSVATAVWLCLVGGLGIAGIGIYVGSSGGLEWSGVFMIAGLALVAEFLPAQISPRGLRVTFTLPYVAALASVAGSAPAIFVDVLATVLAGLVLRRASLSSSWPWIGANAGIAGASAASGALLMDALLSQRDTFTSAAFGALSFSAAYVVVNITLVGLVEKLLSQEGLAQNVGTNIRVAVQAMGVYALVSMAVAVLAVDNALLYAPLSMVLVLALQAAFQQSARIYEHYYETVLAFTLMLRRCHPYTHGHLERVGRFCEDVALKLGLSSSRARLVREAALLHDIGKIAVDEEILDQPRRLTEPEFRHIQQHSEMGASILGEVPELRIMAEWIHHHHERPDGRGYPGRLTDVEIPIESKIIAVADAYDAMTGHLPNEGRSYRQPMSKGEALEELTCCAGSQFDSTVVKAFREVVLGGRA